MPRITEMLEILLIPIPKLVVVFEHGKIKPAKSTVYMKPDPL